MPNVRDISAQDVQLPLLQGLGPRDERHQRRLANAVRADNAHHNAAWYIQGDIIEGFNLTVTVTDVLYLGGRLGAERV
jgi:hypothetical protein